ncbi:hypothetical protein GALL_421610 [mine drainage metagenome]|uniref:Uncharacterized protein n=1 Tax=mine drainage metagenome TaxID=410659 RepID=A0A1J5PYY9_9ZZZZ
MFTGLLAVTRQLRQPPRQHLDESTGSTNMVAGFIVTCLGNRAQRRDGQILTEFQLR